MRKMILPLALSLILLLSACGAQVPETDNGAVDKGASAATDASLRSFTALDLEGNQVDESIFADYELTMINIWATYCGPCLNEMPDLGKLAVNYADKGVRIVGIVADVRQNADGSFDSQMVNTAKELVRKTNANYLHLLPSKDLVTAKLSQVSAVPETIFVDSMGNLVGNSYIGSRSGDSWAAIIDELLSEMQGELK